MKSCLMLMFGLAVQLFGNAAARCNGNFLLNIFPSAYKSNPITIMGSRDSAPFISQTGNSAPCGLDVDLMNYISLIFRINFKYNYTTTQERIPVIQNNPGFIGISSTTITTDRAKLVDFAQYFKTGSAFLVKSTYQQTINSLSDLCGKRVAVVNVTIQVGDVQEQNTQCGSNAITIVIFQTYTQMVDAVLNDEADVAVSDQAQLVTIALNSDNQLKVVGQPYDVQPYGILCNKADRALCCALVKAINHLIRIGIYDQLLGRYSFNYANNGVCPSRINLVGPTCSNVCTPGDKLCNRLLN